MVKKVACLVFCLALLTGLVGAGCAKAATPKPTPAPTVTVSVTPTTTVTATPAPTTTGKSVVWNYASYLGPTAGSSQVAIMLGKALEERTNGRFKFNYNWSGSLLDAKSIPEGIRTGIADIGLVQGGLNEAKFPLFTIVDLPMLVPAQNAPAIKTQMFPFLSAILTHQAVKDEFGKMNMESSLLMPVMSSYMNLAGRKPIKAIADLKGVKIRAPNPITATLFQNLGAVPVTVSYAEVFSALQSNLVDFAPSYEYLVESDKYYQVVDYLTLGLNMTQNQALAVALNRDSFNALPDDLKQILKEEVPKATEGSVNWVVDMQVKGEEKSKTLYKNVGTLPAEEVAKIIDAGLALWNNWKADRDGRGVPGTDLLKFAQAKRAELTK
ncbi:MAG: TRAP transporter substrate-binding protein DctP [Chloroflexi bacterium]|nr:TRAP transporter substrate-binding protein DctP [Chloroflexota bacterium]